MAMQGRMGVVGERDAVLAFSALGLTVLPAQTPAEISAAVRKLALDGYAVIFITEEAAAAIPEALTRYKQDMLPAIIPIPGSRGANGYGMRGVHANVEKAVGADILLTKEG